MENTKILGNIGLSDTESRVYLAALELGESLRKTLADKAGIKRPTLYYEVLPSLLGKGLLTETVRGKRRYLVAQDIQPFLETKRFQIEEAEQLIPQLRALPATASTRPKLLLFEGVEGIKKELGPRARCSE